MGKKRPDRPKILANRGNGPCRPSSAAVVEAAQALSERRRGSDGIGDPGPAVEQSADRIGIRLEEGQTLSERPGARGQPMVEAAVTLDVTRKNVAMSRGPHAHERGGAIRSAP